MPRDSLAAKARAHHLAPATVRCRLKRGWELERALSVPPKKSQRRGGRRKAGAVRPVPEMRRSKAGKAVARWRAGGRTLSRQFGPWGSAQADARYRQFAAEWVAAPEAMTSAPGPTVAELFGAYSDWAHREYRKAGKVTRSWGQIERARDYVTRLYGEEPAAAFTPQNFRTAREQMVGDGLALETVRIYTRWAVKAFRWGAGRSLVPASVHATLTCVENLKPGRTRAAEPKPRRPADPAHVEATLAHLDEPTRAMVRVQLHAGMRPAEVCAMRVCDIDRETHSGAWAYVVPGGKTLHVGKPTVRWIGPQGQAALAPYLDGKAPSAPVFNLSVNAYRERIHAACNRANVPHWTPHQLRHSHATMVAKETGSAQAAADAIGDTVGVAVRHYIHCDPREQARRELAEKYG